MAHIGITVSLPDQMELKEEVKRDFPESPVKTELPLQGAPVWFLAGKLRSHKLQSKKFKNKVVVKSQIAWVEMWSLPLYF